MSDVRLIPYKVEKRFRTMSNVPRGIEMVEAPAFWNEAGKGSGHVTAVIDTGISLNHPDLEDRIVGGRNFSQDDGGDPDS